MGKALGRKGRGRGRLTLYERHRLKRLDETVKKNHQKTVCRKSSHSRCTLVVHNHFPVRAEVKVARLS